MNEPSRDDAKILMDKLAPIQAGKGYYFNPNTNMALDLLQQLLVTKNRHGYMVCPCRLASGKRENDRDIMCPCEYRAPDVAEYGVCFCGLYVGEQFRNGQAPDIVVPERRPLEKMFL